MKSLKEWRESANDVEWENLKYSWGTGSIPVDPMMLTMMRQRVSAIQDRIVKDMKAQDPKVQSFRDVPAAARDQYAKALVVAVLQLFYSAIDPNAAGSKRVFNQQKLGDFQQQTLPQDQITAPAGWKG